MHWNSNVTFVSTDDTRTISGDYLELGKRRQPLLPICSTTRTLRNILLLPYSHNIHWRVVEVNIEQQTFTLVDPFEEASDLQRASKEFENFIKLTNEKSSFAPLKKIKWKKSYYNQMKPHQDISDGSGCGLFIIAYMGFLERNKPMNTNFNPIELTQKFAKELLLKYSSCHFDSCLYCMRPCKENEYINWTKYIRKIHRKCTFVEKLESDNANIIM